MAQGGLVVLGPRVWKERWSRDHVSGVTVIIVKEGADSVTTERRIMAFRHRESNFSSSKRS